MNGDSSTVYHNGFPYRTTTYHKQCSGPCGNTHRVVIVCARCCANSACDKHLKAMETLRCALCQAPQLNDGQNRTDAAGFANMDYVVIAAILAVIYIVYNAQRALAKEAERVPDNGPPRYRLLSTNHDEPILTRRLFRDGPLSWVAETPGGDRIVAYSADANRGPPPQLMQAVRQI